MLRAREPTGGNVEVLGHACGSKPARSQTGYLAELFRFPAGRPQSEVLVCTSASRARPGRARARAPALLVALAQAADRRVEAMSRACQQRLGIAQALIGDPRLVLLDEPTSALESCPAGAPSRAARHPPQRGVAVLLTRHLLSEVRARLRPRRDRRPRPPRSPRARRPTSSCPAAVEIETGRPAPLPEAVARTSPTSSPGSRRGERIYGARVVAGSLETHTSARGAQGAMSRIAEDDPRGRGAVGEVLLDLRIVAGYALRERRCGAGLRGRRGLTSRFSRSTRMAQAKPSTR